MNLGGVDHVAISVRDLSASVEWYQQVLGLERRYADAWDGPPIMLCAGDSCLALFRTQNKEAAPPPDYKTTSVIWHVAFRVDRNAFSEAQQKLRELGIRYRFADHGICHSIYLFDPDGHQIELVTYEISQ
jgi:catechol-2,3-dioxygenase